MRLAFLVFVSVSLSAVCLIGGANQINDQPMTQADYPPIEVDGSTLALIGKKIWHNEAGGSIAGLIHWNKTEGFASLGIGHFIWYPANKSFIFKEAFPDLMQYLLSRGTDVPAWLIDSPCPWPDRAAFERDRNSARMKVLETLLVETVALQVDFILRRFHLALAKMVAATPAAAQRQLIANYYAVAQSPRGIYALIDYVNFKGEGTQLTAQYKGYGWGLKDVLLGMRGAHQGIEAARAFSESARRVLTRRANNGPAKDVQWLPIWLRRCDSYAQPLALK